MNALVYDLEIVKGICGRGEQKIEGIEYCHGWNDHANMGVSVIGAYDYVEERYRTFCADNFVEFFELCAQRDTLISFNGVNFDNRVLCYVDGCNHHLNDPVKQYDLLREIWICKGYNPNKFNPHTHGGFGLDPMCRVNGIGCKSGNGALTPVQWQRGEIGKVIDYCLMDVKLTKDLFDKSQAGPLVSPKGGSLLNLRKVLVENSSLKDT